MSNRLSPAWTRVEPDHEAAVNRRLPEALHALKERIGEAAFVKLGLNIEWIREVLNVPGYHWKQKVRRSKEGEEKSCWSPSEELRTLQSQFAQVLLPGFGGTLFPGTAYGKGCSIIKNAKFHRRGRSYIRLDLKDAFSSVTAKQICKMLMRPPGGTYAHCSEVDCSVRRPMNADLAWVASRLFTRNGRLEQGALIASHLFNRMMERFDADVCKATGAPIMPTTATYSDLVYTRYADDLVISYVGNVMPKGVMSALRKVIARYGFQVNEYKTSLGKNGVVSVPGIVIKNGRVRPNKAYITRLLSVWLGLSPAEREGHRAYVKSFGKSGKLKAFRDRIPLIPRRIYARRLS